MRNTTDKVFILSLDGATFDVLRPLARQGYLPTLERIFQSGLCTELESVIPPVTAPAWTSFMTGKNPGKHGIFDFTRYDPVDCKWKLNNSRDIKSSTLWQILSKYGKRVVVLNLPYTYPTYEVNGVMVAGWDAPTNQSFTYPQELATEVASVVPDYGSLLDLSLWNYLPTDSEDDFKLFTAKLVKSFAQSARLASHFLQRESWDVFMVHFQQTDWIQHKLWGYIERACRDTNDHSDRVENVRRCYQAFDTEVGRLLEQVARFDPMEVILSDHGFGENAGTICANYVLRELGYYRLISEAESSIRKSLNRSRHAKKLFRVLKSAKNAIRGRQALKAYKSWADMAADTVPREKSSVDWSRTKAAFVGGSEVGFIYVNLKDRGPFGCVEPGPEYEGIVNDIISRFANCAEQKNGKKLLRRVCRGREVYSTALPDVLLPDVVVIPREGYVVGAGMYQPFIPANGERGDHRQNGILLVQGNNICTTTGKSIPRLIDLAPTILHALGLPVPTDMDGRVLTEIFFQTGSVRYEGAPEFQVPEACTYDAEETEVLEQRLRALGYVE